MSAPRMTWPVYGHEPRETIAVFFDYGDAASFAMRPADFGAEKRNLYIGNPRYDHRAAGYRFEIKELPDGGFRVAA